jgi:cobalt-precorrin-5B (C1)-methyltransferase
MTRGFSSQDKSALRRGWTTGACATAATRAAYTALLTGEFPDPVTIDLPKGHRPSFALARQRIDNELAAASIVKDAGDDPDVTHGALITATVSARDSDGGVKFFAGAGVGMVTKPGLAIAPGEAAINPIPRALMTATIAELAALHGHDGNVDIQISVADGERLAEQTWNPRLGIVGGISILGTTGVVVPYSCSAWIHSIHRGIDVARASGTKHVAGCTGSTSEQVVRELYGMDPTAMLDMGDFAGGMLKYLRDNPVDRLTIGGGFGKLSKLALGYLDLHSGRSQVDIEWLMLQLADIGADAEVVRRAAHSASANELLMRADRWALPLAARIAHSAREVATDILRSPMEVDVVVVNRNGTIIGTTDSFTAAPGRTSA